MADSSIGKLSVTLSANSSDLEKGLERAEKRMVAFQKVMSSPLRSAFDSLTSGGLVAGLDKFVKPLQSILSGASGFLPFAAGLTGGFEGFGEAIDRGLERTRLLAKEADRLGVQPSFLRGAQLAAGADAEAGEKALRKLTILLGEVKSGSKEAWEKVGQFMNPQQAVGMNPQQFIEAYADSYAKLADRTLQAARGHEILGREIGIEAHGMFAKGAQGLRDYVSQVEQLGLYSPQAQAASANQATMKRNIKLMEEANEARYANEYSGFSTGWTRIKGGQFWHGVSDIEEAGMRFLWNNTLGWFTNNKPFGRLAGGPAEDKGIGQSEGIVGKLQSDAEALAKHFERQRLLMGKTNEELEMYALSLRGATDTMLGRARQEMRMLQAEAATREAIKHAEQLEAELGAFGLGPGERLARQLTAGGADAGAVERARRAASGLEGKALSESLLSPEEMFLRNARRYANLVEAGGLSRDDFQRLTTREAEHVGAGQLAASAFPPALERGSVAQYSFDLMNRRQESEQSKRDQRTQDLLVKANELLGQILAIQRNPPMNQNWKPVEIW